MLQRQQPPAMEPPSRAHFADTATDLPPQTYAENADLTEYIEIVKRRRWLILGTVLLIFGLGMLRTLTQRPLYESTTSILVTSSGAMRTEDISVLSDLQALTQHRSIETQAAVLSSAELLQEAFDKLDPKLRERGYGSHGVPLWAVKVTPGRNTDIITISVLSFQPKAAAAFVNSIASTYFARDLIEGRKATQQARDYIEQSREKINKQLDDVNRQIAAFKERTGMINPDIEVARTADRIATLRGELDAARTQVRTSQQSLALLRRELQKTEATVISRTTVTGNPQFSAIVARIDNLQSERARLLQEYTPEAPEIREIDQRIAAEEQRLKTVSQSLVSAKDHTRNPVREAYLRDYAMALQEHTVSSTRVRALEEMLGRLQSKARELPAQERAFVQLLQQQQLLKGTYDMLSAKYHNLVINEQSMPTGRIVSQGRAAATPVRPRVAMNVVLFFLLGLVCAVIVTGIVERLDDRVHDQETAERLTSLPVMGAISELAPNAPRLLSEVEPSAPLMESFRVIRNNLAFANIDRNMKVIAITSFSPGEGKSTTSANLSIALAMEGKRVLLVNCDLYRPPTRPLVKRLHGIGFSNIIRGDCTVDEALLPTGVEHLSFLPSGSLPPNANEVLGSQRAGELFRELGERFDTVVVDCPPCMKFSDIQVISRWVDGMLLVVANHQALKRGLQSIVRGLRQVGAPLIGVVMNRMDSSHGGYYYDSYYPAERSEEMLELAEIGEAPARRDKYPANV